MLHFGEITNQVFQVFITDNTVKVTDPTVHYLINTFLFICMIMYSAGLNKAGQKVPDMNPFRFTEIKNLPGYKTYFTILEEGVIPSSNSPTSGSSTHANRQRMATQPAHQSRKIVVSQPKKLLGCGEFGTKVLAGLWEGKKKCAVKVVVDTIENVDRVTGIMRALDFHNTIKYHGFDKIGNEAHICMELARIDLRKLLQQVRYTNKFPLPPIEIARQLVKGLMELHERGIVHGNLNPSNILIVDEGTKPVIKIGGYGRACRRDNPRDMHMFRANLDPAQYRVWNAPELYKLDNLEFDDLIKADIYTLGCTIAYLMSRGQYQEHILFLKHLDELREKLCEHDLEVSDEDSEALRFIDLIVSMTAPNPKNRPSIQCVASNQALWSEAQTSCFLSEVSNHLKISENLGRPHHNLIKKKKSTNTSFKKRSSSNRQIQLIENGALARDENPAQEPTQEPEVISIEGLTQEEVSSLLLRNSIREHGLEICRKAKWTSLLPRDLIENLPQYVNYDDKCSIFLIRLIRNLTSHFRENNYKSPQLKEILGNSEDDLGRFFSRRYPLLVPILYRLAQDHKAIFDTRGEFYDPNEDMNSNQTGTLGADNGLFDHRMWKVDYENDIDYFQRANAGNFPMQRENVDDQRDREFTLPV